MQGGFSLSLSLSCLSCLCTYLCDAKDKHRRSKPEPGEQPAQPPLAQAAAVGLTEDLRSHRSVHKEIGGEKQQHPHLPATPPKRR